VASKFGHVNAKSLVLEMERKIMVDGMSLKNGFEFVVCKYYAIGMCQCPFFEVFCQGAQVP
jgi:hypothetical protein